MRQLVVEGFKEGPLGEIWFRTANRTTRRERIAVLFGPPLLLLFVSLLPQSVQESWTLYLASPTLESVYLSNFVHTDGLHLLRNVIAYLFLVSVLLPLAVFADWKRELYVTSLFFFIAVPFVVSYYSIWMLRGTSAETLVGFSGINSAFLGLLPVLLFAFLQRCVSSNIQLHYGLAPVALELAVIMFAWSGITIPAVSLCVLGLAGVALVYGVTHGEWDGLLSSDANLLLVSVAVLAFAVLPFRILVDVGPGVNVYGHFIGFVVGFLFPGLLSLVLDFRRQFALVDDLSPLAL